MIMVAGISPFGHDNFFIAMLNYGRSFTLGVTDVHPQATEIYNPLNVECPQVDITPPLVQRLDQSFAQADEFVFLIFR